MYKFNLSFFFTLLIIFLVIFVVIKLFKTRRSNFLLPGEPNYYLRPSGSYPDDRYMKDPAERMDMPFYEGPYGDMILPDYLGMYDENPDYQDYKGIYPE